MDTYRPSDRVLVTLDDGTHYGTVTYVGKDTAHAAGPMVTVSVSGIGDVRVRAGALARPRRG